MYTQVEVKAAISFSCSAERIKSVVILFCIGIPFSGD
jgi:hypothetical protein